ncbi:MAG: anaerobic sulfatase maturase [Actinomycetota bacterium]|nr:anaerobic sulfatase maturase [Actinomycetota bacterium]
MSDIPITLRRRDETGEAPVGPAMPSPRPLTAPAGFHVLAKPTGAICNLDCSYCFYLEKEELYPGDRFRMRSEVAKAYIAQVIESHASAREITLAWQGGEPTLMGLSFFSSMVAYAESLVPRHQRLVHTIQTNGTLLNEDWARFLAEKHFLVGISIDGPAELHDAYRVDKKGRPTHARVLAGLEHLRRHEVDYNVLCTVHAANADHPATVYRYLRDMCGARFIQFIPIVEHQPTELDPAAVSSHSVDPRAWGSFLIGVFEQWVATDVGTVFVQIFDTTLASVVGAPPGVCVFAKTCGDAVALEHNGDLYSCDHFVDPEHRLGNIMETHLVDLLALPEQRRFGADKADTLPRVCRDCDVLYACNGECPKNRFVTTEDGEPGLNYLCAGYKAFFRRVDQPMRLMGDLLAKRRPAAAITDLIATAPRNSPCPCGSNRKAKLCHAR